MLWSDTPIMATATRDTLLDSAAALFLAQGIESTSMAQVRQHAGVSNGSLFHHFPTKGHLARALYAATLADFHAALRLALRADPPAEAGVRALVAAYVAWVVRQPARARVLHELRRSAAVAEAEGELAAANAQALAPLRDWIARRTAAGEMRDMAAEVWLALVFAPARQLTPRWTAAGASARTVPAALRRLLADAAWAAVAPHTP